MGSLGRGMKLLAVLDEHLPSADSLLGRLHLASAIEEPRPRRTRVPAKSQIVAWLHHSHFIFVQLCKKASLVSGVVVLSPWDGSLEGWRIYGNMREWWDEC